jgi:hypothetical protein
MSFLSKVASTTPTMTTTSLPPTHTPAIITIAAPASN